MQHFLLTSVSDERSFSLDSLRRVYGIAVRKQVLPSHEIELFGKTIQGLQAAYDVLVSENLVRSSFSLLYSPW